MSDPHPEPVDRLASWYDEPTLERIDRVLAEHSRSEPIQPVVRPVERTRRTAAGLALTAAGLTGVKDAVEPEPKEIFEEIDPGVETQGEQFVTLYLVPNNPKASRAIVRPWLAPSVVGTEKYPPDNKT